jgi:CNT family concentrative nucleoside transporter
MEAYNLISLSGTFLLLFIAWLLSSNRNVLNWNVIIWGTLLQFIFALFIFVIPGGATFFLLINDLVVKILESATAGSHFLFGPLALPPGTSAQGETSIGFILAFQALPTIIFFASLMAVLYYLRVMPLLIKVFSLVFTKFMKISGAESLCASSNIFVGIESALAVRPHLNSMTNSELCTILTTGMATIASSVLALYTFILREEFPTIAGHLVSASILSAPAAVVMAKIVLPETGKPETLGKDVKPHYETHSNIIEAIIKGANDGLRLVVGIAALLIALLGLVALMDLFLVGLGSWLNESLGFSLDWSLKGLLGYVAFHLTVIIGVPVTDAFEITKLIGERVVVTEVVAYQDLAKLMAQDSLQYPRSAFLATYALCGFTHVASLSIFIGGIAALVPERTKDLSKIGLRAFIAATLATLMTASVAGTFFNNSSILFK